MAFWQVLFWVVVCRGPNKDVTSTSSSMLPFSASGALLVVHIYHSNQELTMNGESVFYHCLLSIVFFFVLSKSAFCYSFPLFAVRCRELVTLFPSLVTYWGFFFQWKCCMQMCMEVDRGDRISNVNHNVLNLDTKTEFRREKKVPKRVGA